MKIYNALIIGSGYPSLGIALGRGESVICEPSESCDVQYYLSQGCYKYEEYEPKTELGKGLLARIEGLGLIKGDMLNLSALEPVFCSFARECGVEIRLRCRVMDTLLREDGVYEVSVIGVGGIEHILAREVIDMRPTGEKSLTLLFTGDEENIEKILRAYDGSSVEPAFYECRYALHIPYPEETEYTDAFLDANRIWSQADSGAKLLYIAPAFARDGYCRSPVAAFETSYLSYGGAL